MTCIRLKRLAYGLIVGLVSMIAACGGQSGGDSPPTAASPGASNKTAVSKPSDFAGTGFGGLSWVNSDSGAVSIWQLSATSVTSISMPSIDDSWTLIESAGDYNGDGKSDFLWRHYNGDVAIWLLNGGTVVSSAALGSKKDRYEWALIGGRGDYNGDGKSDVAWWNRFTGQVVIWTIDGTSVISEVEVSTVDRAWTLLDGNGDYDGDGKSDLLWRNVDGTVAAWMMNGTTVRTGAAVAGVGTEWSVLTGGGDYNGDGRSDVLWRRTDGTLAVWLMNGFSFTSASPGGVSSDWTFQDGRADYNGDGRSDILWRHESGAMATWNMAGTTIASTRSLGGVPYEWRVSPSGSVSGPGLLAAVTGVGAKRCALSAFFSYAVIFG